MAATKLHSHGGISVADTLRVKRPDLRARFQALCPDAPLPWRQGCGAQNSTIVDAKGEEVCRFDPGATDTPAMIAMILVAVNTCGGFKTNIVNDP